MRAGGAERVALNLVEEFARRGIPTDLVLIDASGPLLEQVPSSVQIVDLGSRRARGAVAALRAYYRRQLPSAVLSIAFQANLLALVASIAIRPKPRIVLSVHSTFTAMLKIQRPVTRILFELGTKLLYPRADAVVAVSAGVAVDLGEQLKLPEPVITIYNPVIRSDFMSRSNAPVASLIGEAEPEAPVIVTVGRLTQAKDQATLIRAVARLSGTRDARLIVVGDGELRSDLEHLARDLGVEDRIVFTGHVPNPLPYMRAADLFVLSSVREGFGNVLVEAMAAGTPVVSTDCAHGPAEILEGGKWGWLVPPGDSEAMAAAMADALEQGGPDSRSRASEFTVERAADDYLAVLFPTLDHPTARPAVMEP